MGKKWKYREKVSGKKFTAGMLSLFNPVLWLKDIFSLFNLRKLIIYALIFGFVASYFYVQGRGSKPVKIDIGYGREAILEVNEQGDHVYIDKKGFVYFRDEDGNVLKQLSVSDIPGLKKKLAPVGFQLQPIFVGGFGISGKDIKGEIGVGISYLRYWRFQLEAFITQGGIYPLATSYKITDNSGAGIALGKGFRNMDDRIMFYYRFNF